MFCKVYRWLIGCSVDDGRGPGRMTSAHMRNCQGCRRYYEVQFEADRALKKGRVPQESADPMGPRAVMRALPGKDAALRKQPAHLRGYRRWAIASVFVIASFSIAALIFSRGLSPEPAPHEITKQQDLPEFALPSRSKIDDVMIRYSIEKELENLSSDIKSVARFFAEHSDSLILTEQTGEN